MRTELSPMNRPPSSRKRSCALIGVPYLLMLSSEASPLRQHVVPPAQRAVQYDNRRSESVVSFSKFWIPSDHYGSRQNAESSRAPSNELYHRGRILARSNEEEMMTSEDVYSHLLVDALHEDVDEVFQELRRRQRQGQKPVPPEPALTSSKVPNEPSEPSLFSFAWLTGGGREPSRRASSHLDEQDSSWHWRRLLRRTSERSDWVSSSTLSSIPGFVNVDFGPDNQEQKEYNITAGTEYSSGTNTSFGNATSANGTNRTGNSSDATTVIFTDSERLNQTNSTTNSSVGTFRPIRIRAYLSEVDGGGRFLSDPQHSMLLQEMLRPALLSWSAALRVDPVVGNLTVDRRQLVDGATCGPGKGSGLPSARVPEEHMTVGVAHADVIVYVNIGFVDRTDRDDNGTETAADILGEEMSNRAVLSQANASAEEDSPLSSRPLETWNQASILRNASIGLTRPTCSGSYLAASAICSTDQYDRSTAGILHVCIDEDFFNETSLRRNIITLRHELAHLLGFNAISLAHFRRSDGTPITPRLENGEVPMTEIECTGPLQSRIVANVTLPSPEILQFRSVRGGVRVAEVVTPSVVQVVRNHFDCQELPGAELESGEYLPLSSGPQSPCFGDHWERRLFKSDLMNPVVEDLEFNPRVSTINLAYFADSGWYQVDLSRAAAASGWGRAAGCDFVEQPCINAEGQVPEKFQDSFCSHSSGIDDEGYAYGIDGCTPDLTKKASCSIELYQGELPSEYQYFNGTYGSNVGGRDALMDYCPVFAGFTNGLCSDPLNEALIRVDRIERFGDRNSRCIPGLFSLNRTALCLRIACVVEDSTFHVQVDGVWKQCTHKDQVIETVRGDRVFCPDPIRVCPTFYCQRDCLGTDRVCNYTQGKCICSGNCTGSEGPENFYDTQTNTSTSLPDEDSPLSDYYVPTSRMLMDESRFLLDDWEIVCLSLGCVVVLCIAAYWCYQKRQANLALSDDIGDNPDDRAAEPVGESALDPNKAKMMASVVVDLRMNTPNLRDDALPDRASETDLSLTDTEGGGTYVTDLSSSDLHPGRGFGIDDSPGDYVDPLAPASVVRRRNVH